MMQEIKAITMSPSKINKYPALKVTKSVPAELFDPIQNIIYETQMGYPFQYPENKKYPRAKRYIYRDITHINANSDLGINGFDRKNYPLYLSFVYEYGTFRKSDSELIVSGHPKAKRFPVRLVSIRNNEYPYTSVRIAHVTPLRFATLMSEWKEKLGL